MYITKFTTVAYPSFMTHVLSLGLRGTNLVGVTHAKEHLVLW